MARLITPRFRAVVVVICLGCLIFYSCLRMSFKHPAVPQHTPNKTVSVLQEISKRMRPPSTKQMHLRHPQRRHYSQASQSEYIDMVSGGLRNGFFVECGAASGEELSNTLFFEKERGWSGLLVEANPVMFGNIQTLNRKSYTINACASLTKEPSKVTFKNAGVLGGIDGTMGKSHLDQIQQQGYNAGLMQVQCYPLHRMLQAIGRRHVNYLSLDVEGPEMDILKTIPFDEVVIDFITVEYYVWRNTNETVIKLHNIRDYLIGTGLYDQIALLGISHPERTNVYEGKDMYSNEHRALDAVFKRKGTMVKNVT